MPLADSLKTLARSVRAIPGQMGLRPHRVYLVTETWTGEHYGDGLSDPVELELVEGDNQPPKVRRVTDEVRALAELASGSVEIGPITPPSAGPISAATLRGTALETQLQGQRLRIVGPMGDAYYVVKSLKFDRAIHWTITAEPSESAPA
jgi:hypothetical protein